MLFYVVYKFKKALLKPIHDMDMFIHVLDSASTVLYFIGFLYEEIVFLFHDLKSISANIWFFLNVSAYLSRIGIDSSSPSMVLTTSSDIRLVPPRT